MVNENLIIQRSKFEDEISNEWICYLVHVDYIHQDNLIVDINHFMVEHSIKYWFMRKTFNHQSHLRIRFKNIHRLDLNELEKFLEDKNYINFTPIKYEPEIHLFGGSSGIEIAHKLFMIISEIYALCIQEKLNKNTFYSLLVWLSDYIIKTINEDLFERWDCWQRIFKLRDFDSSQHLDMLIRNSSEVVEIVNAEISEIIKNETLDFRRNLKNKLAELDDILTKLNQLNYTGSLNRGIRSISSCLIIFMWNIMGVSPGVQGGFSFMFSYIYHPDKEVTEV